MALTSQNPATLEGNGVKIWGAKPRRHPGTDGVADTTNVEIDAAYDDGLPDAAPAQLGKLHGQSHINKGGVSVQPPASSGSGSGSGTTTTSTARASK